MKKLCNCSGVGGGGGGCILSFIKFIKCPVHHSIHSPLFFRKIVAIEDSALREAILDR